MLYRLSTSLLLLIFSPHAAGVLTVLLFITPAFATPPEGPATQALGLFGLVQGADAPDHHELSDEEIAADNLRVDPVMDEEPSHGADATASLESAFPALEVQTLSPSGEPLDGVAVHVVRSMSSVAPWSQVIADRPPQVLSDRKGLSILEGLPPGDPIHLVFLQDGLVPEAVFSIDPETDSPLVVILHATTGLRGRVLDEEGEPVPSAKVRTVMSGQQKIGAMQVRSNETGQFALHGLEPGTVGLEISAPGFRPVFFSELDVGSGAPEELQITLRSGERLTGMVLDSEGSPVPGAEVMLVEPEAGVRGEERVDHSDQEGMFALTGLSPGLRVLRASHPAYPPTLLEAELEGGTTEVELSLEKGIAIFGRVVDGLGLPLADVPVRARRLEGYRHQVSTHTGPEGHFSLRSLAAVRYRLLAEPVDRAFASRVVELSPDRETDVEFRLAQGATIAGVVRGLHPSAVAGLRVAVRGVGAPHTAFVQRDGSYRIENLPVGKWALQLDVAGRLARNSVSIDPWEAEQGAEIWLDLDLGSGYTLSGVIRSHSEPLAGAWVSLRASSFWARAQIAHDGTFRFEGLKMGSYTLGVRDFATGLRYQQSLTVEGDRDLTLDLMPTALGALVRDAGTGVPLAGAQVKLVRLTAAGEQTASQQHSDALGNVNLGNVDGGIWLVTAQRTGYQTARVRVEPRGEPREEVELWLQRDESLR